MVMEAPTAAADAGLKLRASPEFLLPVAVEEQEPPHKKKHALRQCKLLEHLLGRYNIARLGSRLWALTISICQHEPVNAAQKPAYAHCAGAPARVSEYSCRRRRWL